MSYLKSATLNRRRQQQQLDRDREADKLRHGKSYSSALNKSRTNTVAATKSSVKNINTASPMGQGKVNPGSTNLNNKNTAYGEMISPTFTVSLSKTVDRRTPLQNKQNIHNQQHQRTQRPQTTPVVSANTRLSSTINNSGKNPVDLAASLGKGDNQNSGSAVSTPGSFKDKTLKSSPTFLVESPTDNNQRMVKQRHQQQQVYVKKRVLNSKSDPRPRSRQSIVKKNKTVKDEENSYTKLEPPVTFQSQRIINVDIKPKDSEELQRLVENAGDYREKREANEKSGRIEEHKSVVIQELFNASTRRSNSGKSKSSQKSQSQGGQEADQGQSRLSTPTSGASSSSEITIEGPPLKVKRQNFSDTRDGKRSKQSRGKMDQPFPICRMCRQNITDNFEKVQYRACMEEILAQPVRDLVSFSKGVLLLRHQDKLEGSLRLTNLSSVPICFRASSSIANRYKIDPKVGTMDADGSIALRIQTQQVFKENIIKKDRFIIESAVTGEFPLTSEQLARFWKAVPPAKVQRAQTNITFIFDSEDPKFRAILGGEKGKNFTNEKNVLSPPLEKPVQSQQNNDDENSQTLPEQSNRSKPQNKNNEAHAINKTSTKVDKVKDHDFNKEILDLIQFQLKDVKTKENENAQIVPLNNNNKNATSDVNKRGKLTIFLLALIRTGPMAAGFMFFVYQVIKHNTRPNTSPPSTRLFKN